MTDIRICHWCREAVHSKQREHIDRFGKTYFYHPLCARKYSRVLKDIERLAKML